MYYMQDKQDQTIALFRCRHVEAKTNPNTIEVDTRGQKSSLITLPLFPLHSFLSSPSACSSSLPSSPLLLYPSFNSLSPSLTPYSVLAAKSVYPSPPTCHCDGQIFTNLVTGFTDCTCHPRADIEGTVECC